MRSREKRKHTKRWKRSELVQIYKNKGDNFDCKNFRRIKLSEHAMKLLEKVLEARLRKLIADDC